MYYDKSKRCFIFENKAQGKPCAILFYDLPKLLSPGEDICPELAMLAERLPRTEPENILAPYCPDPDAKPHQSEAIDWVIRSHGIGILAYGMGLGKTFIGIRSCLALARNRVLVVCPSHLKNNWKDEIGMWAVGRDWHICEGRESEMSDEAMFTVINRDILADNLDALLAGAPFDQIIVDECHKVGGWGTAAYEALDKLCKHTREAHGGILLLTGTLFKNSPMDAHTALHLLDPKIAGGRVDFEKRFDPLGFMKQEVMGLMRRGNTPQWLIGKKWGEIKKIEKDRGKNGDVAGLRWLLSQYAIRKKYSDVFPDDGKKRETKFISVDLELTDRQRRLLSKSAVMEDEGRIDGELATVLRVVAEKKAPFVADHAEAWLEENEGKKIVIATWHIDAREIIKKALAPFGVVEIQGTPKQKSKAEKAFAEDPEVRVCLINLESGGTGLNLVSAAYLIFSEVPWTSAAFDQVKARIDRMGQDSDTIGYAVFLAADTPEGAKFGTVKKKSVLNDRYL